MIHIGGQAEVNLPKLTKGFIKLELDRYKENGDLLAVEEKKAHYQLGSSLETFIGDFFNWISLITIHDLQIVGGTAEAPEAFEEALLMVTTGSTIWLIATQGLTQNEGDLGAVRFGMRSLEMVTALDVVGEFIEPAADIELSEDFYAPSPFNTMTTGAACQDCGEAMRADSKFCPECGAEQESSQKAKEQQPATATTCPTCGAKVQEGVKFCTQCGESLSGS